MKTYENDYQMIDELYKIMNYIETKYNSNEIVKDLSYDLEDVVVKLREEIEV